MNKKLDGKIAAVTGGSEGIGFATAKRFVADGAHVFITGRRQAELDAAVAEIGSNVTSVQGDVANLVDLDRLYQTIKVEKGRIDVLFANAGVYEAGTSGEISEAHFDKLFDINVRGLFPCRKHCR
jgi:NAD(P)-dependent dehydrogenase (short-subunit alcohol dehydrogenase family)